MFRKYKSLQFIRNYCFLFIIFFLITSQSFAEQIDKTYELAMAKAVSMIESKDYEGAIRDLEEVLKSRPNDEQATLYLGVALNRSGKREAEGMLKKALFINPQNPRTNLELGIYYLGRGIHGEAGDYFENTIKLAPNTEYSEKANEYLKLVKPEVVPKRWSLDISAGGQYDSNVVLDSGATPLPEGISRRSDWRFVFDLSGRYNFLVEEKAEASVGYTFYQSLHTELSDFNITSHLFDLKGLYRISSVFSLAGLYSFEHLSTGGDPYDYAHTVSPSLIIYEGSGFSTVIEYTYRYGHFMNTDLFVDNSDRTGSNNLVGIIQYVPLGDYVVFRAGYEHDVDTAHEAFWSYRGDKGLTGLQARVPGNVNIDLYGEYCNRRYKAISPVSGTVKRQDWISTASILATKQLSDRYSISLGQLYTRNKSNIEAFDYERAITSLFFNVRF